MSETVSDPTPNAQAQAIFGQHQKEISRRSKVVESGALNSTSFPRSKESANDLPFKIPGQEWILFSVSHVRMSPVCEDPCRPAVRFYGLFESAEDASDHARVVLQSDPSVNLQVSRTHEWVSMCSTPERLADDTAVRTHVKTLLAEHTSTRTSATKEFNNNVQLKRGGKGCAQSNEDDQNRLSRQAKVEANRLAQGDAKKELCRAAKLPRTAEVRDQSVAVVSFISDPKQPIPEPLFRVYSAFNTQADADVYVRNTAGEHVRDHDIYVVSLCEWLHPQDIDSTKLANEVYRSEELNSVMANHKSQPQKIEQFKKWREEAVKEAEESSSSSAGAPPRAS
jgi:hypothetical protein